MHLGRRTPCQKGKLLCWTLGSLPPAAASMRTDSSGQERLTAMRMYAGGVRLWLSPGRSSEEDALDQVERHLSLLRPFLLEYADEMCGLDATYVKSERIRFLGLTLLLLLVQNRLAEFHTFLESISFEDRDTQAIAFVTTLERHLMEGNYESLLAARSASPEAMYTGLLVKLEATVQNEIASCFEVACKDMDAQSAQTLMKLESKEALEKFIAEADGEWELVNGRVVFNNSDETKQGIEALPSRLLIKEALNYANELERIV